MSSPTRHHQPAPAALEDVLTPDWLNSALGARFPGIRITKVTPGPVVSRMSTNARFHIESESGLPAGLSPDLCAKGYFTDIGWPARHSGVCEVSFYRDLADPCGVRTLRSVYAGIDPDTNHGMFITEDVVAQGGTFLDATSEYTPELAAESLEQLARLHSSTWGDPALRSADWLATRLHSYLGVRGLKEIRGNFESDIAAGVPAEVRDPERLVAAYRALIDQASDESPWSVIHGDTHVGNLYRDEQGRPSFLDWQLVQRAPWYIDVGYHLASTLTVQDRRRSEEDLIRHYLDRLRAGGVEAPSWDEAWLGVRRGIVHGFYLWGITLQVHPSMTSELQHRLGTAAADHDAYAALGC